MSNYFSKNLKYLREKNNLTISDLAQKINVNASTLSRWENEKMGATVANAYDVANFFNVSVADLTGLDLTLKQNHTREEIDYLFERYRDKLTDGDINLMKTIMINRMNEIDKELDEKETDKKGD